MEQRAEIRRPYFVEKRSKRAIRRLDRNPVSHTLADHDEEQAREQLAVLSFIARRLDDAREAPPEWRGA